LRLIAAGKTDREIERELFISVRTVQRHVADIYVKIGARNRSEATAFALSKLHPFE
jgi:DNA-binding NarL/FixJ family response regulator